MAAWRVSWECRPAARVAHQLGVGRWRTKKPSGCVTPGIFSANARPPRTSDDDAATSMRTAERGVTEVGANAVVESDVSESMMDDRFDGSRMDCGRTGRARKGVQSNFPKARLPGALGTPCRPPAAAARMGGGAYAGPRAFPTHPQGRARSGVEDKWVAPGRRGSRADRRGR